LAEADGFSDNEVGSDRRFPRAVRSNHAGIVNGALQLCNRALGFVP
jgi:hypothetical protein